jgi:hypothetical protein
MNGQDVKYMLGGDDGRIRIECDLVVHRRAEADNLIALEMKKSRAPKADKDYDRTRLQILTLPHDRAQEAVFPPQGEGRLPFVSGYVLGLSSSSTRTTGSSGSRSTAGGRPVGGVRTVRF